MLKSKQNFSRTLEEIVEAKVNKMEIVRVQHVNAEFINHNAILGKDVHS